MAYYSEEENKLLGFKCIGQNVKISKLAAIYDHSKIEIGDNSRIDDFCVISGRLKIGHNVHITPQCLIAGGVPGVVIDDYSTLAYGVKVFSQSDDYSGESMVNSTIPKHLKKEIFSKVIISSNCIIGANSVVFPGVNMGEGTAVGACSLVLNDTDEWSVYVGAPAKKLKSRRKDILKLVKDYETI